VAQYAGKPFAYVGVNTDHTPETAKKALAKAKLPIRSWCDGAPGGPICTRWNIHEFPTWYVIDAKGVIVARPPAEDVVAMVVEKLLK
jgi:hypothetical protein